QVQVSLFDEVDRVMRKRLMYALDWVNKQIGAEKVKLAVQGLQDMSPHIVAEKYREEERSAWKLRRSQLSPCYTTDWEGVIRV
ncbi:MAG: DUF4113 domain-containing protein, partial [Bacteroidia bacterium]|nr:DUF4113 domain-containing protein [Bacteroidia bacterium]